MYQGTTPSLTLAIDGYDLTDATVCLTLENGNKQLTFTEDQLEIEYADDVSTITLKFTQEDTFRLPLGVMTCQVRWVDAEDEAYTTETATFEVNSVLLRKVIVYREQEQEEQEET